MYSFYRYWTHFAVSAKMKNHRSNSLKKLPLHHNIDSSLGL